MTNVLRPIEPPFPEAVAAAFERYPKDRSGHVLALFRVFANSPRFLSGRGVVNLLDRDSPLTLRQREIVILRVTANTNCEYEWGVHVTAFARAAALTSEQVEATRNGDSNSTCWAAEEALLLRIVDALCRTADLDEATLAEMQATLTLAAQLELLALCGNYHTVSYVANVARLAGEPGAATFPVAAP